MEPRGTVKKPGGSPASGRLPERRGTVFNAQWKPSQVRAGERLGGGRDHGHCTTLPPDPPTLPLPLGDHQPHLFSASLEQNEPFGGDLSVLHTLVKISGTVLPPPRLQHEVVSPSAMYTIRPRYSRILYSQVHLLAKFICNPQINAHSYSWSFTDTCRAANNSSCPTGHALD